ncbi:MAG: hypothetical protein ACK2T6_00980 [Anaerolineae bacterium]
MNRTTKVVMALALVAAALVGTGTVASADPIQFDPDRDYRAAMDYFVPELGAWADEVESTVNALAVKPELASELPELAYRGRMMVYDLEGTRAPADIADAHETLVFATGQLMEAAQIAADDPAGADLLMGRYMDRLDDARQQITTWLTTGVDPVRLGKAPAVPVAGN